LNNITYENLNQNDPEEIERKVELKLVDGDGGTNDDGGESVTIASTVTVAKVNDAPVGDDGFLAAILEDSSNPDGRTISSLFSSRFSDDDVGDEFGGIAIVANSADSALQGSWQYSTNAGSSWHVVGMVDDNDAALALSAATILRFVPVDDYYSNTPPGLSVRILDDNFSGGYSTDSSRSEVSVTDNGGETAISEATYALDTAVTAVNDAPDLGDLGGGTVPYVEGADVPLFDPDAVASFSDIDSADMNGGSLTFSITSGGIDGEDQLLINDQGIADNQTSLSGNIINYTNNGVTNEIGVFSGGINGEPLVVTFTTGNATQEAVQALLQNISYENSNSGSPDTGQRTVAMVVNDGTNASTVTTAVAVTAVNDAPEGEDSILAAILEDDSNPEGATVADLFEAGWSDVDVGAALGGVAVVGNMADAGTEGVWQYSTDAVNWYSVGTVDDNTQALALSAATGLRFVPVADYNSSTAPGLSVRILDDTFSDGYSAGLGAALVSVADNGGVTAISSATYVLATTVTAVNDAPVVTAFDGDALEFMEGGGVSVLDQDTVAALSDVDTVDFFNAELTLSIIAGGATDEDLLSVRNQGTADGQISVDGSYIQYTSGGETNTIATLTGGSDGVDLVISFTGSNVTGAAVTALLQNLAYDNSDELSPTTTQRSVQITLRDGGGTAQTGGEDSVTFGTTIDIALAVTTDPL
jgi:hypothetical protein